MTKAHALCLLVSAVISCAILTLGLHLRIIEMFDISAPLVYDFENMLPSGLYNQLMTTKNHAAEALEGSGSPGYIHETLHVLYSLQGTRRGHLIREWEVSLKSVLLHAPIDAKLHVHVLVNDEASTAALKSIKEVMKLQGSVWRNQITISLYNVENKHPEWEIMLDKALRGNNLDERVTLGGYYRLLAHQVLPKDIGPVVYLDVDAVILSNLNHIIGSINRTALFQWSPRWPCSGFMIINMDQFHLFWHLLDQLPSIKSGGDQALLSQVAKSNPELIGTLPRAYDLHMGHGFRPVPHLLLQEEEVGVLHFNGIRPTFFGRDDTGNGLMEYCSRSKPCNRNETAKDEYLRSWGLVAYYVKLSWPWVRHFGRTMVRPGESGHELELKSIHVHAD